MLRLPSWVPNNWLGFEGRERGCGVTSHNLELGVYIPPTVGSAGRTTVPRNRSCAADTELDIHPHVVFIGLSSIKTGNIRHLDPRIAVGLFAVGAFIDGRRF